MANARAPFRVVDHQDKRFLGTLSAKLQLPNPGPHAAANVVVLHLCTTTVARPQGTW